MATLKKNPNYSNNPAIPSIEEKKADQVRGSSSGVIRNPPRAKEAINPPEGSPEAIRKRISEIAPKPITSVSEAGPKEMQDILARRQAALAGFEAPELEAARSQMAAAQQAAQSQRERALQQGLAKQGIQGGAAAALQALAAQMAAREQAGMEQDLFLKQAERQRQALGEYEGGVKSSLDQAQKQEFARVAALLGGEQLIASKEGQKLMADAIAKYGTSMKQASESIDPGPCCFIFLEADGGVLDRIARRARDELMTPKNRRGYYKLAEVLVPLMRKSKAIKHLVNFTMVRPMILAGKWYYGESKINRIFAPIAYFWLGVFEYLGQDHPYLRENGELI